ncbi:hypothetical protein [Lacticaseibacillus sp. GG6-2]
MKTSKKSALVLLVGLLLLGAGLYGYHALHRPAPQEAGHTIIYDKNSKKVGELTAPVDDAKAGPIAKSAASDQQH